MKSATEIMLNNLATEATEAHLGLLAAAKDALLYLPRNNPTAETIYQELFAAIARCQRWSSMLPQPEKASR